MLVLKFRAEMGLTQKRPRYVNCRCFDRRSCQISHTDRTTLLTIRQR